MKKLETPLVALAGGAGTPPEPSWAKIYTNVLDVAAARETWRVVTEELARAQTLSVANGATIERLVRFQVEFRARRGLARDAGRGEADRRPRSESFLAGDEASERRHPNPRGRARSLAGPSRASSESEK